jgi:hypothetical protein
LSEYISVVLGVTVIALTSTGGGGGAASCFREQPAASATHAAATIRRPSLRRAEHELDVTGGLPRTDVRQQQSIILA